MLLENKCLKRTIIGSIALELVAFLFYLKFPPVEVPHTIDYPIWAHILIYSDQYLHVPGLTVALLLNFVFSNVFPIDHIPNWLLYVITASVTYLIEVFVFYQMTVLLQRKAKRTRG